MNGIHTSSWLHAEGRLYRGVTFATVFAMVFAVLLLLSAPAGQVHAQSAGSTMVVVDGRLNLRNGPSTDDWVILVMPDGANVTLTGESANGFYQVTYNGSTGWAFAEFLSNGESSNSGSESVPVGDAVTGNATVDATGGLRLRQGPGTGYGITVVMPNGVSVEIMGNSQSGWYPVRYNGNTGWASGDYLNGGGGNTNEGSQGGESSVPVPGSSATGSAMVDAGGGLRLRTGPSTNYGIVVVMPNGTNVSLLGDSQNGWWPIAYGNHTGWASGDFLVRGSQSQPDPQPEESDSGSVPVPGTSAVATMQIDATGGLRLRTGPSTSYDIVVVMKDGAQVSIVGDAQGGWYPISYDGRTGWSSGEFLVQVGSTPDPEPEATEPPEPEPTNPPSGESESKYPGVSGNGDTNGDGRYTRDELVAIIEAAADHYDQPLQDMIRVAGCESVWDVNAVNPISGTSGLFQFLPSTWATTPYAGDNIFDPRANAFAAAWMWSVGRRNEWACQ